MATIAPGRPLTALTMRRPEQGTLPLGTPHRPPEPPKGGMPEPLPRRSWELPDDYGEGLDIPAPGGVPPWLRIALIDD